MKLGIIRERKIPPDTRVPLTPDQCQKLRMEYQTEILVEPSPNRCYSDQEYADRNIVVTNDLSSCDILLGVKEPTLDSILKDKTYFVFSHTIKEQAYNRELLTTFLKKNVRLIDYEVLTNEKGQRLIAFGYFAGLVGAHNALWTWDQRMGRNAIPRLHTLKTFSEVLPPYQTLKDLQPMKIVLTGDGRVASGSVHTLEAAGIRRVAPTEFVSKEFNEHVYTQLGVQDYAHHPDGSNWGLSDFFNHPSEFRIDFKSFYRSADIMINGIYWDPSSPPFFNLDEMRSNEFKIRTIADITCDIAPDASIPSTIKPSTIDDPVYGFDPQTSEVVPPHTPGCIDVMAIDNLPNEVPRDASESFGNQFIENIFPELMQPSSHILARATISKDGKLGPEYIYLRDYVNG